MRTMYELKEKLCRELDEIGGKPELSAGDLEAAHKLTDTIKNIDKIEMMEEDGGYSRDGRWEAEIRGDYARGNSYSNRGKHYVRGHYSRNGYSSRGYSRRGYSRNGYSRDDGREQMMEHLRQAMEMAGDDREREAIERMMDKMEDD